MKTKTDRIIHALKQIGCAEVSATSRKYRRFTTPTDPERFYFVGKAGGLRVGKNVSSCVSLEYAVPGLLAKFPIPAKAVKA